MLIGTPGDAPAPGGAGEEAHLHEIGLVHVLQGDGLLVDGGGQGLQPHGAAAVVLDDAGEHPPVDGVQSQVIHLQGGEGLVGHRAGDHAAGLHLGEVPHTPEELALIVTRSAGILDVPIEQEGAMEIAKRSRGTPRIANRMLRRVRDFAQVKAGGVITREVADQALTALEVDFLGLDNIDRRMLRAIIEFYGGGPVGLETLAATINEEAVTLEDVYEPYLMQIGFLTRTPRGRCVTRKAYEHLHMDFAAGDEQLSFQ